jgi:hypothetical protein
MNGLNAGLDVRLLADDLAPEATSSPLEWRVTVHVALDILRGSRRVLDCVRHGAFEDGFALE